ncbi:INO80 complex subunit E-like [Sinocyclocheilus anshuiensis]|uniref:INO80 complex subunit E-like n=1 Tax=Sinocyclocheilus anshuiensis TaxID=1608454 RepID=UPI0007B7F458|nr:PREDICTED: INO80 complex subunit E-like [Sinocyclocheilus anshuiensis]
MNGQAEVEVDYKRKYKNIKRKLKFLVYEQECFQEELRRAQRKLLKVSRDKSFLLDRLLQYERVDEESSDSDATVSSDSDGEGARERDSEAGKKRRSPGVPPVPSSSSPHLSFLSRSGAVPLQSCAPAQYLNTVVGPLTSSYPAGSGAAGGVSGPFSWVPQQMLSEDAAEEEGESEGESDRGEEERGEGDEAELVIDIPNE